MLRLSVALAAAAVSAQTSVYMFAIAAAAAFPMLHQAGISVASLHLIASEFVL